MEVQDVLWLSYKDLREKKVRTALTIVMVMIGVAAIVALTSVTAGISQSISSQLNSLGPTSIVMMSGGATGFTAADLARVAALPNVTDAVPILTGSADLYAGNQNISVTVIGTTGSGLNKLLGGNVTLYQGAIYPDTITPEAVLGHSVAFPAVAAGLQKVEVGQSATLKAFAGPGGGKSITLPVIGILPSHASSIVPIDTSVFLSLPAAEIITGRQSFNDIFLTASNASSVNATASLITNIYGSSVRVITIASILSTVSTITGSLGLLFGAIAGVSLLVAAIGIMNIMLIAVYERIHEIGIMKSVGFKNKDILMIFLSQALIIGFIGGIIGIAFGAGASYGLAAVFSHGANSGAPSQSGASPRGGKNAGGGGVYISSGGGASGLSFHPVFPASTIVMALVIAIVVSMVAGVYPAWRASKMEPIDALRQL